MARIERVELRMVDLVPKVTRAVPNGQYVEDIPQLDEITDKHMVIAEGHALAPSEPGIGIDWDWDEVKRRSIGEFTRDVREA